MSLSQINDKQVSVPSFVVNYRTVGESYSIDNGLFVDKGGMVIDGNQWTRLHVFELEEGQYEFYKVWAGNPAVGLSYWGKPFSAKFTVTAGKATYAGMLEFHLISNSSFEVNFIDKRDRDISIVSKEWPSITEDKIDYVLFHGQ